MKQGADAISFLGQTPLLQGMEPRLLDGFAVAGGMRVLQKGQILFLQGDPAEAVYFVRGGVISLILSNPDGRELVIGEMQPNDFFGELALLIDAPRSTGAMARLRSDIFVLPGDAFLRELDAEPQLTRRCLELTARRLHTSSDRESNLAFMDAQARLANLLLQLDSQAAARGYITVTQAEMAQRLGLVRQTVAKILGNWRRAGWLITGRGRIMVLRYDALEQIKARSEG